MATRTTRPTAWDVILGILIVVLGLFLLGNAAVATAFSVWLIGLFALIGGVMSIIASLFRIGGSGFWSTMLSGILMAVLGVIILRNTAAGALALTLVAAAVFLTDGVSRLVLAFKLPEGRVWLAIGGLVSLALGLIVLFNLFTATFTLLGILIGVYLIVAGITLMAGGWAARRAV